MAKAKQKTILFYNISWDTDGEDVKLPKKVIKTVSEDTDLELEGADQLSNEYGFCVNSFSYKVIETKEKT